MTGLAEDDPPPWPQPSVQRSQEDPLPLTQPLGLDSIITMEDGLITPKIIGGAPVNPPNKYPWVASLQYFDYHFCGATLIDPEWALTAAHCWTDGEGNVFIPTDELVVLGEYNLTEDSGNEQPIGISEVFVHPDFNVDTFENDVALMKLTTPATLDSYAQLIDLVASYDLIPNNQDSIITGWGTTNYGGSPSNILRYANVKVLDDSLCSNYGPSFDSFSMLCAGDYDGLTDSCQGDSGGPLFFNDGGTWKQAGIVSWGYQCGVSGFPGVYTRLTAMKPWIIRVIGELETAKLKFASVGLYEDKIYMRWEPVDGATSYRIFRATSTSGPKTKIAIVNNIYDTTYFDFAVQPATKYYYWVRAVDPWWKLSGFSNWKMGIISTDTYGVYDPNTNTFYLRNQNNHGPPNLEFQIGYSGLTPITGDWDGDGVDTIGFYAPNTRTFKLTNNIEPTWFEIEFTFGQAGKIPLSGDWDGDGIDTIGIYDPDYSTFKLRNSNSSGSEDIKFKFGNPGFGPVTGDWDGDGIDTIGTYDPPFSTFRLRNSNSAGPPDITTKFGNPGHIPLAADWTGSGVDTIATYDPTDGRFYVAFDNISGAFELAIPPYGEVNLLPLTGNWNGK